MLLHPHGSKSTGPGPRIASARGLELQLEDGRTVLDFAGSPGILGHSHPKLMRAMREAAEAPAVGEAHFVAAREAVADELLAGPFAGEDWAAGVRFCTTASEAIDLGLSLAQTITGREPLVAREYAYHGASGLARSVSTSPLLRGGVVGGDGWRNPPRGASLRIVPAPDCGSEPHQHHPDDTKRALAGAAAVIADYGSGSVYPCRGYQDQLAREARSAGALWLQDEAVTGFGRTGRWFAFQRGEERPDLVALGKGLTAGYAPGGVLVLSQRMLDALGEQRWVTFSTWRGHTLTLAALRATMQTIQEEDLVPRAASLGEIVRNRIAGWADSHPSVERVSGEGIVWNIDLRGPEELRPDNWDGDLDRGTPAQRLEGIALDRGLSLRALGALGIWFFPSMNMPESQLERALDIFEEALYELEAEQDRG